MAENVEIERAIRKAEKALSLAQSSNYANEAETAMRQVEKLLAKYNLSMADLDPDKQDTIGELDWYKYTQNWQRAIISSISELYGCYMFGRKTTQGRCNVIVGKAHNVKVAIEMSGYVIRMVQSLCARAIRDGDLHAGQRSSFYAGAFTEISVRVRDMIKARTAPQSTGTDLVLSNAHKDAKDLAHEVYDLTAGRRSSMRLDNSGFSAGRNAAGKIGLNDQMRRPTGSRQLT